MQDGTTHPGDLGAAAVAAGRVSPAPANAWTPALVAAAGEGASWWMVGDRVTLRVPASATGGVFSLLEIFVVPGGGGPPHNHGRESETFHVVEGEVTMLAGGRRCSRARARRCTYPRARCITSPTGGRRLPACCW